jgi:hypothetical protein
MRRPSDRGAWDSAVREHRRGELASDDAADQAHHWVDAARDAGVARLDGIHDELCHRSPAERHAAAGDCDPEHDLPGPVVLRGEQH